jgi:hypothetical protein
VERQGRVDNDSPAARLRERIAQQQARAARERDYAAATECVAGFAPVDVYEPSDERLRQHLAYLEREHCPERATAARDSFRAAEMRRRMALNESWARAGSLPRVPLGAHRQRRSSCSRPATRRRPARQAGGGGPGDSSGDPEPPGLALPPTGRHTRAEVAP